MSTRPKNAIVLQTYKELDQFVQAFANGKLNLLFVIGGPGLQKSHVVRAAVGERACWIDGNATPFGLYCELFRHRNELVVIDDVDRLYTDRTAVRLLKCLCQTERRKRVGWHSDAATLRHERIPRQFKTSSQIAIIANEWRTLDVNVAAVQDRGHLVLFEPSAVEVHVRTAQWFWDQEVFDFISDRLHLIAQPSMRAYVLAWELKQARLDWKQRLLERWGLSGRRLLVARLKSDPTYATEEDRVRAFVSQGAGCRATYFNHARKLQSQVEVPRIRLRTRPPTHSMITPSLLGWLNQRYRQLGNG